MTIDLLAYADKTAIVGNNIEKSNRRMRNFKKHTEKVSLIINGNNKTERMILNRREADYRNDELAKVENNVFERVSRLIRSNIN